MMCGIVVLCCVLVCKAVFCVRLYCALIKFILVLICILDEVIRDK
jgi:hypothetical protein